MVNRSTPGETAHKLAARDEETWAALTQATDREFEIWPELVNEMLTLHPIDWWRQVSRSVIEADDSFFTKGGPIRNFESWLIRSALDALPPDDAETFALRRFLVENAPGSDGGFEAAKLLLSDIEAALRTAESPELEQLAPEVELLVAKGAFTIFDFEGAYSAARGAARTFRRQRRNDRYWFAQRQVGAACIGTGEFEEAFAIFEKALSTRGPLFGGGVSVTRTAANPQLEAVQEMVTICAWADLTTPEYVRAIGGLAERWDQDDEVKVGYLWRQYEAAAERMFAASRNPESDIEVVVRQSGQRGLVDAPTRALVAYLREYPEDEWAHRQLDILGRYARLDMLAAKLDDETDVAIDGLFELFDDVMARDALEDGNFGFRVTDTLIDALLAHEDDRAVDVQQHLLDHKLQMWGECPAAWLERQNLGSVLSTLGRKDEARALIEDALGRLRAHFGDDHQHVRMAERNLARIDAPEPDRS